MVDLESNKLEFKIAARVILTILILFGMNIPTEGEELAPSTLGVSTNASEVVLPDKESSLSSDIRPWEHYDQDNAQAWNTRTTELNRPEKVGSYYETTVPDTLDLAERARLGVNHFVSVMDDNCEMYWTGSSGGFGREWSPLMACEPKCMEVLAMERLMSGSTQGLEKEAEMIKMLLSNIGEDGIYWVPLYEDRPWLGPPDTLPRANVHGQARMLRAMNIWYQYTGNPIYKEYIQRMVKGMDKLLVVHKDDYAYFPVYGWLTGEGHQVEYFRSSYTKRGWRDTTEPTNEKFGEEGSMFNHQGHTPGALANWYLLSDDKQALRLSGELVNFLTKPKLWADFGTEYPSVVGTEHAHWAGHWHGHINTLRAVLEYAIATNDTRLKEFVRDGYEWSRQPELARVGIVGDGQGCGCGRLIGLAVKLSQEGIGDYWEDIDLYIRNHGVELQFVPEDAPHVGTGPAFDSLMGGFASNPSKGGWALCCSPHGNMGLFYAWDGTLQHIDGRVKVNLLLNRASPWMDVDSYLPYEGKVVLKNKTAKEASVRIPLWVDKSKVQCAIGDKPTKPVWDGRYVVINALKPDSQVTIEFPMAERTEKWTVNRKLWGWWPGWPEGTVFTLTFKGNTLIEISPSPTQGSKEPDGSIWWPYSQRAEKYKSNKAPMKKVKRYVTEQVLQW